MADAGLRPFSLEVPRGTAVLQKMASVHIPTHKGPGQLHICLFAGSGESHSRPQVPCTPGFQLVGCPRQLP